MDELRPQQFAFLLFMFCVWVLARRERHPRAIWLIPVAIVPWANLHGSFPIAFVLLLFAWLEDRRITPDLARAEVLVGAAGVVATLIGPFGARVWPYVWDLSTHPVVSRQVAEWSPPTLHSWTGRFFFASLFAVAAFLARRRPPVPWRTLAELAVFATLGLLAIRGVAWWGLYAPVIVAGLIAGSDRSAVRDERSPINAVVIASLVVLAAARARPTSGPTPSPVVRPD